MRQGFVLGRRTPLALIPRRQAQSEMPMNMQLLKQRLEVGASPS